MKATFLLVADIKEQLEEAFAQKLYRVPVDGGRAAPANAPNEFRQPLIHIGHMPAKRSGKEDQPFVLIRPLDGEITGENPREHAVKVAILCSIYTAEGTEITEAGYHDIMNMSDVVWLALAERRFWGGNTWVQILPIKWVLGLPKEINIYEAGLHEHPFYGSVITGTFKAAAPVQKPPPVVDARG